MEVKESNKEKKGKKGKITGLCLLAAKQITLTKKDDMEGVP